MGFSHSFPYSQTSFPITLKLKAAAIEQVKTKRGQGIHMCVFREALAAAHKSNLHVNTVKLKQQLHP